MQDYIYLFFDSARLLLLLLLAAVLLWRGARILSQAYVGWNAIIIGLILVFLASIIDLFDDYPIFKPILDLLSNHTWTLLEKVFGYFLGTVFISYGIYKLVPSLSQINQATNSLNFGNKSPNNETSRSSIGLKHPLDELMASEQRYEILSELSAEGIAIHSDGQILEVNQAFCRQSGYAYQELIGMKICELFTDECIPEMQQRVSAQNTEVYESIFVRKDGSQWPAEIQGREFIYNGKQARAATVRNISQKKQMLEQLNTALQYRHQVIHNTPIILFALDTQGVITLIDGKSVESLEFSNKDIVGQSIFELFKDNKDIIQETHRALTGVNVQYQTIVNDICFGITLTPLFDAQKNVIELSGVAMNITSRHKAELAMRESEEKYHAIVDGIAQIGDGLLIIDKNHKIIYMNSILKDWFGEQTGQICYRSFGGEDAGICEYCKLKEVTEENHNVLYQIEKPNGRHYEIVGAPIKLSDGRIAKLEVIRDVTDVEKAAEKLRMLSYAVEQSSSSIIITDCDSHIEYVNQQFCENSGYSAEEVLGKKTSILKSGLTSDKIYQDLWQTITRGKNWHGELLNRCKNGELYWERSAISPFKNPNGKATHYLAIKEDISQQKKSEETLRLSATVFNTASEAVMISDANNTIQMVNKAFCQITGYEEQDIIGQNPVILSSGRYDSDFYKKMWKTLQNEGHWEGEIWNRRKNGEVFPEWLAITLVKDNNNQLSHYVSLFSDISKRKKDEERILYQANYDALTRLPNRNLFKDRLSQAIERAERDKHHMAVLFIDLDRFKHVNDSMGHLAGDQLLQEVSNRLLASFRASDTTARLGGDEFTAILSDFIEVHVVEDTVIKLLDKLEMPYLIDNIETFISASIGIAVYPDDGQDVDTLLINADNAMYRVKDTGRKGYHFFTQEMNVEAQERQILDTALHQALDKNEFILHYQPIIDLSDEQTISTEALVRWQNPERGLVSPLQFIPLAEDTGLIVPIGEWILYTACHEAASWTAKNGLLPGVSVNLSVRQFQRQDITKLVRKVLSETQLSPERLTLEITESLLVIDDMSILSSLHELREMGVELSIDDFGTGYSSLSYLKRFPITKLKIDRSFITDVTTDSENAALVEAILSMAQSLGLKVIAEGVETREQVDFLKARNCDRIQGYYFSRPVPGDELEWVNQ